MGLDIQEATTNHIDQLPKVESHFCRSSSSREYLHPDLSKSKMYDMFLKDWSPRETPPNFSTYTNVFKQKNLSIHRLKEDQCSLCLTYLQGDEEAKEKVKDRYEKHVAEKKKMRELKDECKKEAQEQTDVLCASFDLQQVIYLPISQENAIFYKRRLSSYNLTFYNIGDKNCHCFTWHQAQSKCGASEISTAVFKVLQFYDQKGVKRAYLFSNDSIGQNKNTIMPAMMLFMVSTSRNIEEISLRLFESFHCQNEEYSAHSAISHALKSAGTVIEPSQLTPIFSLTRSRLPYITQPLEFDDFIDFKLLPQEIRSLDARRDSGNVERVTTWSSIMELRVLKQHPGPIFYKTSHSDEGFKTMSLKRLKRNVGDHVLQN